MNLAERFYEYLKNQGIADFTTWEARQWYEAHKQGKTFYYSNLNYLILRPLLYKGLIKKLYRGYYIVTEHYAKPKEETLPEPVTTKKRSKKEKKKDDEFFDYLNQKMKGGMKL